MLGYFNYFFDGNSKVVLAAIAKSGTILSRSEVLKVLLLSKIEDYAASDLDFYYPSSLFYVGVIVKALREAGVE